MAQGIMQQTAKKLKRGTKTGVQPTKKNGFIATNDTSNKSKAGKLK